MADKEKKPKKELFVKKTKKKGKIPTHSFRKARFFFKNNLY
jgi:hypothetical protein